MNLKPDDSNSFQFLTIKEAAETLQRSEHWILDHLDEFPHTIRLPDAGSHPNDLRFKESDIAKLMASRN